MSIWSQPQLRSLLKYLWVCSVIFLVWQGVSSYPKLPERLATHFDMSGNPDRWSSKSGFFTLWYLTIFGINGMWVLTVMLTHRLLGKKLAWAISIPNKDYWLSTDERRSECAKLLNTLVFGLSFLTNLMWAVIYHGIVQNSISVRVHIGMWMIWASVGVLLLFSLVYMLTAFRKPVLEEE